MSKPDPIWRGVPSSVALPEPRPPLRGDDLERARAVVAKQRKTAPEDGDLSPAGSLRRAKDVVVGGFHYHDGMRTHLSDLSASFDGWPHGEEGPQRIKIGS